LLRRSLPGAVPPHGSEDRMIQPPTPTDFSRSQAPREAWLARALPEPALEPELPIIDTHMHLWDHATGYRYFAPEYARDIAESGHQVEASIYAECNSMYRASGPAHLRCVGETEFALGQAAIGASGKYGTARIAAGIVAFADLQHERLAEVLDAHHAAANGRLRGIRQRAKWDPDPVVRGAVSAAGPGLYLDPGFQRGLAEVASRDLVFEASIYHPQIPDVTALARAVPQAGIVLIHCGSPVGHGAYRGRGTEVHARWLADMTELARCPNVTVKLGGLLMTLAAFDFRVAERPPTSEELAALWRPWIEPCLTLFGAERCMVASNFPVDKAGFGYRTVWNMYKRIAAGCAAVEKAAIFHGTAARVYRV
jgi:predicted TIM-barrel fold metal-dependent hydrolase